MTRPIQVKPADSESRGGICLVLFLFMYFTTLFAFFCAEKTSTMYYNHLCCRCWYSACSDVPTRLLDFFFSGQLASECSCWLRTDPPAKPHNPCMYISSAGLFSRAFTPIPSYLQNSLSLTLFVYLMDAQIIHFN